MKKLTTTFVIAAVLLNAMAPTLAHAATYLQGAEVNANTLVKDAYVQVTYYDGKGKQKLAKGWIDAIGETTFEIRSRALFGKETIAYDKVVSVIMSDEVKRSVKQINEVDRFMREMRKQEARALETEQAAIQTLNHKSVTVMVRGQIDSSKITKGWYAHVVHTYQGATGAATSRIADKDSNRIALKYGFDTHDVAYNDIDTLVVGKQWHDILRYREIGAKYDARVRFKAPSIAKNRIIGTLVNMTQDTLVIQSRRTFFQVPRSEISNLEVGVGKRRNAGKGMKIGAVIGLGVLIPVAIADADMQGDLQGLATALTAVYVSLPIFIISTFIGAAIKTDKWVEVSPQRLNLSVAPTSTKGLRAALTFNF